MHRKRPESVDLPTNATNMLAASAASLLEPADILEHGAEAQQKEAPAIANSDGGVITKLHFAQTCVWTSLLELPRKSSIPNLLFSRRRNVKKMTNWASFYLPHLAHRTMDDSLSLAIAAYVAARMQDKVTAVAFYIRVLHLLRQLLRRPDCAQLDNQDFLRIWATTVLLAKLEDELGNLLTQAQHIEGATTLALIAKSRFGGQETMAVPSKTSSFDARRMCDVKMISIAKHRHSDELDLEITSSLDCTATASSIANPPKRDIQKIAKKIPGHDPSHPQFIIHNQDRPANETGLPFYLMNLTRQLRHSSLLCETVDIDWSSSFSRPSDQVVRLEELLEKSAECYAYAIPLVDDFHAELFRLDSTAYTYLTLLEHYQPRYLAARKCLDEYDAMLQRLTGPEYEVFSDMEHDFPFGPRITFANLQFAQPYIITHVFRVLLAPFLSVEEHDKALRTSSAVLAELQAHESTWINSAWPELFLAAFWKRGAQRAYFSEDIRRRKGDWARVIKRIWHRIDSIEHHEHRPATKEEILCFALFEHRQIYLDGFKLQHAPTWHVVSVLTLSWAVAVGMPDPTRSRFASPELLAKRRKWPNIRHYQHRITLYRQNRGHVLNLDSAMDQLVLETRSEESAVGLSNLSDPHKLWTHDRLERYENWEEGDDERKSTEIGTIVSELFRLDIDKDKIFYIM
ncbi:protein of unknown function [Taphrina deformans PYCC 5710]|uniref:Uncharacterized protein n=1 Tax=Taphrina deformans (strain PYCC 5710 / ATCC 11124 / CBS 356.35 / IMI 108563 / JCM 9778 / NBRC 8474) TaxID=1097556 RepID=R4XMU6_TAPDE|nr:protein of unknown function [Taphrina deformans PYCC 5710]|eukprot:CCG84619.1 protein of unknown function [Taphrina deformans PYCC 5710]